MNKNLNRIQNQRILTSSTERKAQHVIANEKGSGSPRMPVGLPADELLQLPAQCPLHAPLTGQVNTIHGLRLRRFFAAQFITNLK
jgi:hypothetical protein